MTLVQAAEAEEAHRAQRRQRARNYCHAAEPPPDNVTAEVGETEQLNVPRIARLPDAQLAQDFVDELREATLERSGMSPEAIARMRNPPAHPPAPLSPVELLAVEMYLAHGAPSEENYRDNRRAIMRLHPEDDVPTFEGVQRLVARTTGIDAIKHDMCVNSCIAYTGPFDVLDRCPICPSRELRYDREMLTRGKRVPRRTFSTFPLGPQIQILQSSPDTARLMRHRREVTRGLAATRNAIEEYNDLFQGSEYLEEVFTRRNITDSDVVLMLSIDGAQLYASKSSDCWFLIWVVFDLPPEFRYKKRFVLPAGVIGGPNKPKNMDSFLFPTFYHISAVQWEGLAVWDALQARIVRQNLYVVFGTADTPGLIHLSGGVGHQGFCGCRTACGQEGRHKPGSSTYYPAMLLPDNYTSARGRHGDINYRSPPATPAQRHARYVDAMRRIRAVTTEADYQRERCDTGFGKPSIFLGLQDNKYLFMPICLPMDPMHHLALNMPDLVISLFRGTIHCDTRTDSVDQWDWACFRTKEAWEAHGALVEQCARYLPGSFGHTPRNIAQKITSGYKAEEWMLYMYTILPALLLNVLPREYFIHFCHLVAGVRLAVQRRVKTHHLTLGHTHLLTYVERFEVLYYRRRLDRLHFIRPALHLLVHLFPEIYEVGSGPSHSQWTLENFIGNITLEAKQHVNPYANVAERAQCRVQVSYIFSCT